MNKKLFALLSAVVLVSFIAVFAVAESTVATVGSTLCTNLQDAVNAYSTPATPIQLKANITEDITISKDVYLDLNGFDVTGKVTVTAGTLYCLDSQTDDYEIGDNAGDGYGQLTNVTGKVAGAPCSEDRHGYLMVKEGTALSFHQVNLKIHAMSLRAEKVGVYYKSYFAGDRLVAANVKNFGIALSVKENPTAENINSKCKYSTFEGFQAGYNDKQATSTLLKNVMKPENTALVNNRNSTMPVYGRAYILTNDGEYVFGNGVSRDLKTQVELASKDTYWNHEDMTEAKKDAAVAMYRIFKDTMRKWDVRNIESRLCLDKLDPLPPANKESLKVLAITSSFGLNTTQMLYDVAVAQGYAPENVTVGRLYASGCTLQKHLQHAPSIEDPASAKGLYQYSKVTGDPSKTTKPGVMQTLINEKNADKGYEGATLLDGLLDEDWDIIFMQQGARQAPLLDTYLDSKGQDYIDQVRAVVDHYKTNPDARFVWNMLWAFQGDSEQNPFNTVFNKNQTAMYQANIDAVMKYVIPRTDFDRLIPTGTVIQNARTSEFGDKLCRDTYHLNNYGGIIAAYGLYAVITGQEITSVNIDAVTVSATNGIGGAAKITTPLTATQKAIIKESVNNALKNPFAVTQSQYPQKDYSSYTYTENLKFIDNTNVAVCPACDQEVAWTEINQQNAKQLETAGLLGKTLTTDQHFYLSEDVEFTAATASNSVFHLASGVAKICVHLNGNDLTATNCAISIMASTAKLNMMGTGIVSGNHTHSQTFRGSAFVLNSGTSKSNPGILRLYSGTYVQPASNTQLAPVSTSFQGGMLEIFEDATITGNASSYSVALHTSNNKSDKTVSYDEIVNIYGGTFSRPVHAEVFTNTSIKNTVLNISGGTFNDGIEIVSNADVTLSGNPVIKGAGLKLPAGTTVTLGTLTSGAKILVDAEGAFTAANTNAADYLQYFSSATGGKITANNNVLYSQTESIYAKNLSFDEGTNTAYCAACGADKEWTEVNQTNLSSHTTLGTSSAMTSGTYHFYLSSDVTYEGTNFLLNMNGSNRNVCFHLNGNDLTATQNGIGLLSSSAKLNMLGTGTVIGNHTYTSIKYRGSAFVLNSATTNYSGILRLYSGTYVQPEGNIQLAPVCLAQQGGLLEIYADATLTGNSTGYSLGINTTNYNSNTKYNEKVRIYGGTFNRPAYFKAFGVTTADPTVLELSGGTFNDGIEIVSHTNVTLSGAPVIKGAGLKLPAGTTVTLGTLTEGASIKVDATGAFTVANANAADYLKYFSAVKDTFAITAAENILYCNEKTA